MRGPERALTKARSHRGAFHAPTEYFTRAIYKRRQQSARQTMNAPTLPLKSSTGSIS
jgi:hypothetical protein